MRFHRLRPATPNRKDAKRRGQNRLRRVKTLELLEGRVLLAGDTGAAVAPWHNALNAMDVNHDNRVSPIDALLVINDLTSHGSHAVPSPIASLAALPMASLAAATSSSTSTSSFLDVNGDNRITPLDALRVINLLATPKLLQIHTFATDLAGLQISSIAAGSTFKIATVVQDVRSPVSVHAGVFAAYANVTYLPSLVSVAPAATVNFDPFFSVARFSNLSTPGSIGGIGAASGSLTAPGNTPQPIWNVLATAVAGGVETFTPSFDSAVGDDSLLYGVDVAITSDQIDFVGDSLTISGLPALSVGNVSHDEGNSGTTPFVFTVTLSSAAAQNVTVGYTTNDNSATSANNDYQPTSGTLTFTPSVTSQTVTVLVNGDTVVEPDEAFFLDLDSNAISNAVIGNGQGTGTILNDDALPSMTIGNALVTNVTSGTTNMVFTATLSATSSSPVTVAYATSDVSAVAGTDYTATSGTLTFAPSSTTGTVTVAVLGDATPDITETFLLNLSSPSGATLQTTQATGTILPALTALSASVTDVAHPEGNSGSTDFVFTVNLSTTAAQNVVVNYTTADGTATTANNDYVPTSGTLTFTPGQTSKVVTVSVVGDTAIEPSETFFLNVHSATGAFVDAQGTGTITDDDGTPTVTIDDAVVAAPISGLIDEVFTVHISGKVAQPVTVGFATSDGTAVAAVDYLARTGLLTFLPGGPLFQTITVPVLGVATPQADKTFFVNLSSVSPAPPAAVIGDAQAIGTIVSQGVSIGDVTVIEGNSGTTDALFTVSLSKAQDHVVTVAFGTADGTATVANNDYVSTAGTLTFSPGATSHVITVAVIGDATVEPNETFKVNLSNVVGSVLYNGTGSGTILNDDGQKAALLLKLADAQGNPLAANATLNLNDSFILQAFVQDIQVSPTGVALAYLDALYNSGLVMVNGPVTYGANFPNDNKHGTTATPGLLNDFGGFQATQPAQLGAPELLFSIPLKTIDVGVANFTAGPSMDALLPIQEFGSDTAVPPDAINFVGTSINIGTNVFSVGNASLLEGNSGLTNFVFTVTRNLPSAQPASVQWSTSNGSATLANNDYLAASGTLTFTSNTTATFTVQVVGDTTDEPNENFFVSLSNPLNATTSQGVGAGTILNDDAHASVSVADASASEGQNVNFVVSLSAVSGQTVTVAFQTADSPSGNKATAGLDYQPASGTLTFAPGVTQQTVSVHTLVDAVLEPTETFQLLLGSPTNATLGTAQAQGSIVDVAPAGISGYVYVDLNNDGIKEGTEAGIGAVMVTATRSGGGFTQSTLTNADGSYTFIGLPAGTYTVTETQPGFFADGRDTRFGVDSPTNDQFSGVVLTPGGSAGGFNFGELGVRAEFVQAFINRRAFFASAIVTGEFGPQIATGGTVNPRTGDVWISFDGGWDGQRTIEALFDGSLGGATLTLYNNSLNAIASSTPTATGASLQYNGVLGAPYFLRISGTNASVSLSIGDPVPNSTATTTTSTTTTTGVTGRFASSATAAPAPAPTTSMMTSATDVALATGDEWLTDSLLA
jgi:hypothetical protein